MLCLNTDLLGCSCPPAGSCQPHLFIQNSCRPNMTNCFCRNGKRCGVFTNNTFLHHLSVFTELFGIHFFLLFCSVVFVFYFFTEPSASNSCVFPGFTRHWWGLSHRSDMGTQGSGRKRAPVKDRFSAEDEALSSIAREVSSEATRIQFLLICH